MSDSAIERLVVESKGPDLFNLQQCVESRTIETRHFVFISKGSLHLSQTGVRPWRLLCAISAHSVWFVCLFGCLTSSSTTRLYRGQVPRQSVLQFYVLPHMRQSWETMTCLSRSHYIDTDPTSRERAATAGIEPGTSSPEVARSTD